MLSHVHVGVDDFARALAFYGRVLAPLGLSLKFQDPERRWAGWVRPGTARPLLLVRDPDGNKICVCCHEV